MKKVFISVILICAALTVCFAAVRKSKFSGGDAGDAGKQAPEENRVDVEIQRGKDIKAAEPKIPDSYVEKAWDSPNLWAIGTDGKSSIVINSCESPCAQGLEIKYELKKGGGWVQFNKKISSGFSGKTPFSFLIKARAAGDMEIKFIDKDGSTFWRKIKLNGSYKDWQNIVVYDNTLEYAWGGDDNFDGLSEISLAFSGTGAGTVWLDEIGFSKEGLAASFPPAGPVIDPDSELSGIGDRQRRAEKLMPEDKLVLEWLKVVQDASSPEKQLLPSMEGNQAQTFNNALVAMAFILKGEKERAERILDFFSDMTFESNPCPLIQNFFYKNEPRGFFQYVVLTASGGTPAYHNPGNSDRWMGDMAWLLIAYKYYEKTYSSDRYRKIEGLLKGLLKSWYKGEDSTCGYVRHGWRDGDSRLHENHGHPEGNIDCYAAFLLCGENDYAKKIRKWLDKSIKGKSLPLDLYTWRVLAFGSDYAGLLNIPEYDLRYRKTVDFNGKKAVGFYHSPDNEINNVWLDGTGHIACAFISCGDKQRGYFYANEMDKFIVGRKINNIMLKALPYTANKSGGFEWVRQDRGFISVAAWYIFAKNGFNPLTLKSSAVELQ
ncbi:MAG: hypothetical protein JW728_01445 [Candidatus Aureabacteria bacterium]|nr:hypothetical protein [Candidatus Auribacterota bacterium]